LADAIQTGFVRFESSHASHMQITRAAEYGVLGLTALARRPLGEVVMIETLCVEEDIPNSFLGKILQSLSKAGIVKSARGSGGGFSLARNPAEVTALEIIEAIEGPISLQRCLDEDLGCEHSGGCALCSLLAEAQERVKEVFGRTTLADLTGRHIPNGLVRQARSRSSETIPVAVNPSPLPVAGRIPLEAETTR
jgi:Rrf2 family protein